MKGVTSGDTLMAPAALLLAVALPMVSCTQSGEREVEPVVFGLLERLTPEAGSRMAFSGIRWDRTGVKAYWEIESVMEWPAFSAWVRGRVPPDFVAVPGDGSSLEYVKTMPGDSYVLRLTPIASTTPPRVRVELDGHPF